MDKVYSDICFRAVEEMVYTKYREATDAEFWEMYLSCMEEFTGKQRRTA